MSCTWTLAYYEHLSDTRPGGIPSLAPTLSPILSPSTNNTNVTCACLEFTFFDMVGTTWNALVTKEDPRGSTSSFLVDNTRYYDETCSPWGGLHYMTVLLSGEAMAPSPVSTPLCYLCYVLVYDFTPSTQSCLFVCLFVYLFVLLCDCV